MTNKIKVNQPTAAPTRKMSAVLISGALFAVVEYLVAEVPALNAFEPILEDVGVWIQLAVMGAAGYFTKEKVVV